MSEDSASGGRPSRLGVWALLVLSLVLPAGLRVRFLDLPLNRDEGEYAYVAQLLLQGVPPYAEAYSMRWPGIYGVYAGLLAAFGHTHVAVHLGLLLTSVVTAFLLFLLARHLYGDAVGLIAAATYGVLSVNQHLLGFAAYTEHFVVLPAVAGLLVLLHAVEAERPLLAFAGGLLLALATLIKQPGLFFVLFGAFWIIRVRRRAGRRWGSLMAAYALGVVLPGAITLAALLHAGVFPRFWFWTMTYASEYVRERSVDSLPQVLSEMEPALESAALPALLVLVGLTSLVWDEAARTRRDFVVGLLAASLLAIAVGLYLRPHYFILLLPVASVLAAVGTVAVARWVVGGRRARLLTAAVFSVLVLGISLVSQRHFLFQLAPSLLSRAAYFASPYPEALEIAHYLRAHTTPYDRIVIIGSEPEIYFYAGRRAATGYIYMYPLVERHRYARMMQQEMIREITAGRPAYLVMVYVNYSWAARPDSETLLLSWLDDYLVRDFERVGVVDILSHDQTAYYWDGAAAGYARRSRYWVEIFRRKSDAQRTSAAQ